MVSKLFTGTILGAGLLAGYSYFKKLKRTQTELDIVPNAYLHQINWEKIVIRIEVLLKNPTNGSFTMKFPYVKILYKDATVGSSQAVNKNVTIPAYGQVKIEKLLVEIPVTNLFTTAAAMLKEIQNKKSVQVKLKVLTTVDLGLMTVPYETIEDVTIKK